MAGHVELICEFVSGHGCTLFAHDSAEPHATLFYNYNNDPEYLRLYAERYVHMNPLMPAVTLARWAKWSPSANLLTRTNIVRRALQ